MSVRLRKSLFAWLAIAVLLSQWVAAWHSVAHLGHAHDHALGHDHGSLTCQLLDQLGHAAPDAPPPSPPAALLAAAVFAAPREAVRPRAAAAHYLARAPPVLA